MDECPFPLWNHGDVAIFSSYSADAELVQVAMFMSFVSKGL